MHQDFPTCNQSQPQTKPAATCGTVAPKPSVAVVTGLFVEHVGVQQTISLATALAHGRSYFAVNSPCIFELNLTCLKPGREGGGRGTRLPSSGTQAQGPELETVVEERVG